MQYGRYTYRCMRRTGCTRQHKQHHIPALTILNCGPMHAQAMQPLAAAGLWVIAAAGNEGMNLDLLVKAGYFYGPCVSGNATNVVCVAASQQCVAARSTCTPLFQLLIATWVLEDAAQLSERNASLFGILQHSSVKLAWASCVQQAPCGQALRVKPSLL